MPIKKTRRSDKRAASDALWLVAALALPLLLRIDPRANIVGEVDDFDTRCFNPRQKLHRFPPNQSDILQVDKDQFFFLLFEQLSESLDMLIVHFSAKCEDDRLRFH